MKAAAVEVDVQAAASSAMETTVQTAAQASGVCPVLSVKMLVKLSSEVTHADLPILNERLHQSSILLLCNVIILQAVQGNALSVQSVLMNCLSANMCCWY